MALSVPSRGDVYSANPMVAGDYMRCTPLTRLAGAVAIAIGSALPAQQIGTVAPSSAKTAPGSSDKKVLGLADIGRWNRITYAALSSDGKWMTYIYTPNEGDGTLYFKQLDGGKTYTIP